MAKNKMKSSYFSFYDEVKIRQEFSDFSHSIQLLGEQLKEGEPKAREPRDLDLILEEIAVDQRDFPNRLAEIMKLYGVYHGDSRVHAHHPSSLSEEHLKGEYRLTWEFLLLAPPTTEIHFMQRSKRVITKALARQKDPASIPVLVYAFETACQKREGLGVSGPALERQLDILIALTEFQSVESLKAVLSCLESHEELVGGEGAPLPLVTGKTLVDWVVHFLSSKKKGQAMSDWGPVSK